MDENLLMVEVKNGKLDKASHIFDLYHKRLFNFFVKLTFDRETSHDLTQTVFLKMLKYRHSFNEEKSLKSWLYQIARNVHLDHVKTHKIRYSDSSSAENLKDDTVEEQQELAEKERLLKEALAMLPVEMREVLVLSKFQCLKYEEIASILNITVANVKVKVHRSIIRLKELYFQLENHQ
jgi:RNA polymerase sigma-70 factor (ECF subfamily)